jgi:periplasmic mercuric ion binding protein
MYYRIISFLALLLLAQISYAKPKVATIQVKASIYCDHCKKCESCGKRLENAIYTEKGIKRVDIDEKTNIVSIVYNSEKTSPEKLRQAIAKAGYDADDVKGDAAAYATWDDCCKKQ